jgi:1,4-dihydroxy-2-naphthoate octaprenyltransferase
VAVVFALAAGAPALVAHPVLAWVVLGTVVGGLGYSHGPGLKYRALGDLAVLALCGPVLTGGYAVAAFGRFDWLVLALGAAFGMAAIGILHVNNTQDIANDRKAGARTVAMALGERRSMVYLGALYLLSLVGWPVIAWTAGLPVVAALLPLISVPPALKLVRKLVQAIGTREGLGAPSLNLVRIEAAQVHLAFGAMVSVGLGVALALA